MPVPLAEQHFVTQGGGCMPGIVRLPHSLYIARAFSYIVRC